MSEAAYRENDYTDLFRAAGSRLEINSVQSLNQKSAFKFVAEAAERLSQTVNDPSLGPVNEGVTRPNAEITSLTTANVAPEAGDQPAFTRNGMNVEHSKAKATASTPQPTQKAKQMDEETVEPMRPENVTYLGRNIHTFEIT